MRCAVEYDGTNFFGFQYQPRGRTVAGTIEAALSKMLSEPIKITGAGRTDTGVHATGQVITFSTARTTFPFERLNIALNSSLPDDLSVRDTTLVSPEFSARFSARERAYVYVIHRRPERSALLARRAYHVYRPLDAEPMRAAASHLVGEHDFRSFCATLPDSGVTVRIVKRLDVEEAGDFLYLRIAADGFLHRMVRTITGTLVECGLGRRDPGSLRAILAERSRAAAGLTAPAHGLYLAGVRYADGYNSYCEPVV